MPKLIAPLSERAVSAIKRPGRHAVGGVPGLHLKTTATHRGWVFRVMVGNTRRDFGLGSYPTVGLAEARRHAREIHDALRRGELPEGTAATARKAVIEQQVSTKTFAWCVEQYLAAKSHQWRNVKHRQQWANTLAQYAGPIIGRLPVADVALPHVMEVLTQPQDDCDGRPLWEAKTETASRLRGRIERVLDWATVSRYREGENPARWRGHLDALLAAPNKLKHRKHQRALAFADVPRFMVALRNRLGISARALELTILTAARSGEVRGATWDEFDLETRTWTVPAERMKAGRVHRVPLSDAAVTLLRRMPRIDNCAFVFPSSNNRPLSDMSLTAVTRRMGADCVPHGFRSSFRDWAAERRFPRELAELCLAHTTKSRVEEAYWRGDALEARAEIMQAWSDYCAGIAANNVVRLHA